MQPDTECFAIVGGGFGLYGYLPALINVINGRILLPVKYRETISARRELAQYDCHIDWQPTIEMVLAKASGVVIAVPPRFQFSIMKDVLRAENIRQIIIEKPVAPTPDAAKELFDDPLMKSKKLRVGYLFLYTDWYPLVAELVTRPLRQLKIVWHFEADHISKNKETWKRYHSLGGGALRFYGIHLIAVLASLGYKDVKNKVMEVCLSDQPVSWTAIFCGEDIPQCEVIVSTVSVRNEFSILSIDSFGCTRVLHSASSPFPHQNQRGEADGRVPILERLIRSLELEDTYFNELYRRSNILWDKAELFDDFSWSSKV